MIDKIEYQNKQAFQNDEDIPENQKVTDLDMNEIKKVVNNNAEELNSTNEKVALGFKPAFVYKGSVNTYSELASIVAVNGDIYTVNDEGKNYVYNGTKWIEYNDNIDINTLEEQINNLGQSLNNIIDNLSTTIANAILEKDKLKYPIGKIIMQTTNTNPSTYLGFGEWVLWGKGKVPVGVNTNDTDFNTVEKEVGSKTVNIKHSHEYGISIPYYYGMPGGERVTSGVGVYDYEKNKYAGFAQGSEDEKVDTRINNSVQSSVKTVNADIAKSTGKTSSAGSTNINVIQPSITCYMFKRVS